MPGPRRIAPSMPRATKPEPSFEYRHLVLLASVLFYFFGMGGMFLLVVALKPMALDFGWSRSVPSLAFALQFIGSGIGGILMGYWTDRWGAGRPVLLPYTSGLSVLYRNCQRRSKENLICDVASS